MKGMDIFMPPRWGGRKTMNRKIVSMLSAATIALGVVSMSHASPLVSETFSYPDGGLVGNTPSVGGAWNAQSAAGLTPIMVSSGEAVLNQGSGSREDDNVPFDGGFAASDGTVLVSSFDLTVPDPGAAITPGYFAAFLQGTGNYTSRVWITTPSGSSGYRIALMNGSATPGATSAYSNDLTFGQTYTITTTYDYTNKSGSLFIDTTDISSGGIAATDSGFSDAADAYAFRQAAGNTQQIIDNLTVSIAPEPASLSLLGMGAIGLIARRRK